MCTVNGKSEIRIHNDSENRTIKSIRVKVYQVKVRVKVNTKLQSSQGETVKVKTKEVIVKRD